MQEAIIIVGYVKCSGRRIQEASSYLHCPQSAEVADHTDMRQKHVEGFPMYVGAVSTFGHIMVREATRSTAGNQSGVSLTLYQLYANSAVICE